MWDLHLSPLKSTVFSVFEADLTGPVRHSCGRTSMSHLSMAVWGSRFLLSWGWRSVREGRATVPTRAHTDLLEDPQHVFGAISHHQKHWYILLSLLLRIRARSHMDIQSTHGGFMPTLYGPHFISPQTCVKHSLGARHWEALEIFTCCSTSPLT